MSEDVAERWKNTKSRKQLIVALINCNGDKASLQQAWKHVARMVFELLLPFDTYNRIISGFVQSEDGNRHSQHQRGQGGH